MSRWILDDIKQYGSLKLDLSFSTYTRIPLSSAAPSGAKLGKSRLQSMERLLHRFFMTSARYGAWANEVLYEAVTTVPAEAYPELAADDVQRFCGVLNSLLVTGRLWFTRLQGYELEIDSMEEELYDDLELLCDAQLADDVELCNYVHGLAEEDMLRPIPYRDLDGAPHTNAQHELLAELFSQQALIRGRTCQLLSEAHARQPALKYLQFLRETRKR